MIPYENIKRPRGEKRGKAEEKVVFQQKSIVDDSVAKPMILTDSK